jgi:2-C-methyl-D-erythritol 4-phosphate cytidylyltransferase
MSFAGGNSGMASIHNYCLKDIGYDNNDLVLIHDSVRPLLCQDIISSNIAVKLMVMQ